MIFKTFEYNIHLAIFYKLYCQFIVIISLTDFIVSPNLKYLPGLSKLLCSIHILLRFAGFRQNLQENGLTRTYELRISGSLFLISKNFDFLKSIF